jgi:hypothetical protein
MVYYKLAGFSMIMWWLTIKLLKTTGQSHEKYSLISSRYMR